jgi:hypothetical protein
VQLGEAHATRDPNVEQAANAGGSLWEWPELDELEHYDTGDLYPDRVYALLQQVHSFLSNQLTRSVSLIDIMAYVYCAI